jgi:hypothetical protein
VFLFLDAYIYLSLFLSNQGLFSNYIEDSGLDLRYNVKTNILVFAIIIYISKSKRAPYFIKVPFGGNLINNNGNFSS